MKDPFDPGLWFLVGIAKEKEEVEFIAKQFSSLIQTLHHSNILLIHHPH